MIINVHVVASIHSDRTYAVTETVSLLQSARTGTEVVTDVPNTTLISDLILAITTQLGITNLPIHEPFHMVKLANDDIFLDATKTLAEEGIVANDVLHLRVTMYLA
jgi:hypothetical protein